MALSETPETVHGRLLEAVHISGYSFERACSELDWLLQDDRWQKVGGGFDDINAFLSTIDLSEFRIAIDQRKKLAKQLQDIEASQRATAKMLGVDESTVRADLGKRDAGNPALRRSGNAENGGLEGDDAGNPAPEWFQDDVDPAQLAKDQTASKTKKERRATELEEQRRAIEEGQATLPEGVFEVICIDPPWPYGNADNYNAKGFRGTCPYPEMSLEELTLIELPIADDCFIWLWTTHQFMRHAFTLLDAWGFQEKSILTWVKPSMGTGRWLRSQSEFCIMAVKGKPVFHLTNQTTVIHGDRREHSRKPDEFYQMVEALCIGRRLDYFSREKRPGWAQIGSEPAKFDETP